MIFTGYTLLTYFLQNKKDYFPTVPVHKLFIKENLSTSKNYIYILGLRDGVEFKRLLFVKQSKSFDSANLLALNTENEVYERIAESPELIALSLQKLDFDTNINLLVLAHSNGEDAKDVFLTYTAESSFELAVGLSTALAKFHIHLPSLIKKDNPNFLIFKPAIFSLTNEHLKNIEKIREMNAKVKVSTRILSPVIVGYLDKIYPFLGQISFAQDTLIHNDMRPSNFFREQSDTHFKLIDWELACWGDKYWDLAGLLDMFLEKTQSINWLGYTKDAIVNVWDNYHKIIGVKPDDKALLKTIQFVGLNRLDRQIHDNDDDIDSMLVNLVTNPEETEYRNINIWRLIKSKSTL